MHIGVVARAYYVAAMSLELARRTARQPMLDGLEYAAIETVQRHSGITCLRKFGTSHMVEASPRALGASSQSRFAVISRTARWGGQIEQRAPLIPIPRLQFVLTVCQA